jgi:hypothetical protein
MSKAILFFEKPYYTDESALIKATCIGKVKASLSLSKFCIVFLEVPYLEGILPEDIPNTTMLGTPANLSLLFLYKPNKEEWYRESCLGVTFIKRAYDPLNDYSDRNKADVCKFFGRQFGITEVDTEKLATIVKEVF